MNNNHDDDFALALQMQAEEDMLVRGSGSHVQPSLANPSPKRQQWLSTSLPHETFAEVSPMRSAAVGTFAEPSSNTSSHRDANTSSDSRLAAFLQALEFEINDETVENRYANFEERELSSSSWKKQVKTISTAICVVQVRRNTDEWHENAAG